MNIINLDRDFARHMILTQFIDTAKCESILDALIARRSAIKFK